MPRTKSRTQPQPAGLRRARQDRHYEVPAVQLPDAVTGDLPVSDLLEHVGLALVAVGGMLWEQEKRAQYAERMAALNDATRLYLSEVDDLKKAVEKLAKDSQGLGVEGVQKTRIDDKVKELGTPDKNRLETAGHLLREVGLEVKKATTGVAAAKSALIATANALSWWAYLLHSKATLVAKKKAAAEAAKNTPKPKKGEQPPAPKKEHAVQWDATKKMAKLPQCGGTTAGRLSGDAAAGKELVEKLNGSMVDCTPPKRHDADAISELFEPPVRGS